MAKEIDALRPLCDFLVVSMHWGSEYEHTPTARQQELARFLAARDVDLVIGHHPHVLQPLRALPREAAPPMVCFFSLGNFLSAQNEPPRLLGGMMRLTVKKEASPPHRVTIEEAELLPLVTHYEAGYRNFRVFPLGAYTEDIAALHLLRQRKMYTDTSYFHTLSKKSQPHWSLRRQPRSGSPSAAARRKLRSSTRSVEPLLGRLRGLAVSRP